jgi:hypothetical protein
MKEGNRPHFHQPDRAKIIGCNYKDRIRAVGFLAAYNFAHRLKTLDGLMPYA